MGVVTLRKEGFVSQRGPRDGGVVCTRQIKWPGGTLLVNVDAHAGEMKVRLSDELRKPVEGFNHDDMPAFTGDSVAHEVRWNGRSLAELEGKVIRLEFLLRDADLYTFCAGMNGKS